MKNKTVTELEKRAEALQAQIDNKSAAAGAALLAGKDPGAILADLAKLQAEEIALRAATAKAYEAQTAETEAAQQAQTMAIMAEAEELNKQAAKNIAELAGYIDGLRDALNRCNQAAQRLEKLQRVAPGIHSEYNAMKFLLVGLGNLLNTIDRDTRFAFSVKPKLNKKFGAAFGFRNR